jgi:hypothetical protein
VRKAILDIEMSGYGNKIKEFYVDGESSPVFSIPCTLTGTHSIKIVLGNNIIVDSSINLADNYVVPETPVASICDGILKWNSINNALSYQIIKNGGLWRHTDNCYIKIPEGENDEYQIFAIGANMAASFASEPVMNSNEDKELLVKIDAGKDYVEISKEINTKLSVPVYIPDTGIYSIRILYANGSGPINTDNKCAVRTLCVNGEKAGVFVFPQRGLDEWSNWGFSNIIQIRLKKGKNTLELNYDPLNENMDGYINRALVDAVIFSKM